jgi:Mor family transcriptional regulator
MSFNQKSKTSTQSPTPALDQLTHADPDLVDRIFDYILADPALSAAIAKVADASKEAVSKLKTSVRAEFVGETCYISGHSPTDRQQRVSQVLALFNGRNATEVARTLRISRATVYRYLKQPG